MVCVDMLTVVLQVIGVMLMLVVMFLAGLTGWLARQRLRERKKARRLNRLRRQWPLRTRKL